MESELTAWLGIITAISIAGLGGIIRIWSKVEVLDTRINSLEREVRQNRQNSREQRRENREQV